METKTKEIKNAEIQNGVEALQELEDEKIEGDLIWAVAHNLEELEDAYETFERAYNKHVQDQVKEDDEGNPVYPPKRDAQGNVITDDDGEPIEDRSGDPLFEDKEELVQDLNNLLQKEVELDLIEVSKDDFPSSIKPKQVRNLKFMISDFG